MEEDEIEQVLKKRLTLKLMHFEHLEGAPTQIVSQLVLTAYVDNFDYFYQVWRWCLRNRWWWVQVVFRCCVMLCFVSSLLSISLWYEDQ